MCSQQLSVLHWIICPVFMNLPCLMLWSFRKVKICPILMWLLWIVFLLDLGKSGVTEKKAFVSTTSDLPILRGSFATTNAKSTISQPYEKNPTNVSCSPINVVSNIPFSWYLRQHVFYNLGKNIMNLLLNVSIQNCFSGLKA